MEFEIYVSDLTNRVFTPVDSLMPPSYTITKNIGTLFEMQKELIGFSFFYLTLKESSLDTKVNLWYQFNTLLTFDLSLIFRETLVKKHFIHDYFITTNQLLIIFSTQFSYHGK